MRNSNWITGEVCTLFKKDFCADGKIVSAKLSVTAMGVYEAFLNGERVGNFVLAPGFTSYNKRHLYQEYDITDMVKKDNEIIVSVGEGWYRGQLCWEKSNNNYYGDTCGIIAKIEIAYSDRTETIYTDESWLCGNGPVLSSGMRDWVGQATRRYL